MWVLELGVLLVVVLDEELALMLEKELVLELEKESKGGGTLLYSNNRRS